MQKFLLLMLGLLTILPTFARTFTYEYEGQTLTYTVLDENAKTCEVSSGGRMSGDVKIPAGCRDNDNVRFSVIGIGNEAFRNCSVTSIRIPNSVTSIGNYAFSGCTSLTSITIPESVTSIGDWAFEGCTGLTSVTIPESVTSIGEYAFADCTGLKKAEFVSIEHLCSIEFGGEVSNPLSYANHLYIGGEEITEVVIPESVTSIGKYAFDYCTALTSITIPESVTSIGEDAFEGCTGLKKAKFASIEHLCSIKFGNKSSNPLSRAHHLYIGGEEITEVVIPESVTSIGWSAFSGCTSLTSVTIPEGVTSIGGSAFYGCTGLTAVTIPEGVTSIGGSAFYGCTGLTAVTIPESVTSIGVDAFEGCTGLKKAKFASIEHLCSIKFGNNSSNPLSQAHHLYIGGEEITEVVIPESVTSIGGYAFYGCTGLTSITIPEGVTSIGEYAFYGCTGLTSITIPEGVTSIGDYAFTDCTALTSIPEGVTSIGKYAFYGCTGLTSVTISGGGTTIGGYAFCYCTSLTSVTILEGVTSIGEGAFCYCSSLTSVTILEGVTSIGKGAFYYCSSLASVTIPEGVTSIGYLTFSGCTALTSITIPESVTSIGFGAWNDCDNIEEVKCFAMNPVECTEDIFTQTVYDNAVLYIPVGSIEHYEEVNPWKHFYDIRESLVSGIEEIAIEGNESEISNMMPAEVYDLNGSKIADSMDNLPKGIYILRQGNKTSKIAVK